jgi:hypothetical protein
MLDFPEPQVVKRVISTEAIMTSRLQDLLDEARKSVPTAQEKEEQRRSFAYGNTKIENSRITRELVAFQNVT